MPFKKRQSWQQYRFTESLGSYTNCPQSKEYIHMKPDLPLNQLGPQVKLSS